MEGEKIALTLYWKTKKVGTIRRMAERFGFELYMSVNRRTNVMIRKEDMPLLMECEKRGLIEISRKI